MQRPILSNSLSADEFNRWCWLKSELVEFCRTHTIATSGSKQALAQRISSYLAGQEIPKATSARKPKATMPKYFEMSTVIEVGWRCTQELRAFFEAHYGKGFRFNEAMRSFISTQAGKTLSDALEHYKQSLQEPKKPIAEQFEYNRHMRAFYAANPNASRGEAIAAWWDKRIKPDE